MGLRHNLGFVGFGFFFQPRSRTDGARNHIVGISLGIIFGAFALLTGFENIVKRSLNLLGRTHTALLQIDADNLDAHLVAVQDGLHQVAHPGADLVTFFGQCRVHAHFADDFTHSRFSGLHHGAGRVFALKQVSACIAQAVLHCELDFHNVLVFGQHRRLAQAGGLDNRVTAHINRADLSDHHHLVALHRVGQTPVKTGADGGLVAAELGNHRLLTLLDYEKACAQPDQHSDGRNQADADTGAFHVRLKTATTPGRA